MKQNNESPVMPVIGITGGVGSGKSKVLEELGTSHCAVICQADDVARELQQKGRQCYEAIVDVFGRGILDTSGEIDRKKLAEIVFSDPVQLKALNKIVHPAVKQEILRRINQAEADDMMFFVIEAALLLEDNYDAVCDEVWYIYTDEDTRRMRLKESRGYSDEKIDSIMKNQMDEQLFFSRCDRTINNSGCFENTKQQINKILSEVRNKYKIPLKK